MKDQHIQELLTQEQHWEAQLKLAEQKAEKLLASAQEKGEEKYNALLEDAKKEAAVHMKKVQTETAQKIAALKKEGKQLEERFALSMPSLKKAAETVFNEILRDW